VFQISGDKMTKIHELAELGQAVWLDYIRRSFVTEGQLKALIDLGLRGITSNPTIFEKAIAQSSDYDADIQRLTARGKSVDDIFLALSVEDIQQAADLLRPVYNQTNRADGFVSLEVKPTLARDSAGTLAEANRLWSLVNRPNLMVKIPATKEGLPAISSAIAAGININVTLIFALERYDEVMDAYLSGLEQRLAKGQPLDQISSVASFFVSRVDTKVDKLLQVLESQGGLQAEQASRLMGHAAVANAKLAYTRFQAVFQGRRFKQLSEHGAQVQRPLWASTSTKNPSYSDILYVQELIGSQTINTLPQETLEAFLDHGVVRLTLEEGKDQARQDLQSLEELGISMAQVTKELEDEGVAAFSKSFISLMDSLKQKRERLLEG
jgi:transaldolase